LMGDLRAVEPLLQTLSVYKDPQYSRLRAVIAEALGRLGDVRAVKPLLAALKNDSEDVAKASASALERIDDLEAVEPMLAALKDERPDVRAVAAAVLGNTGDMGAVEPLLTLLNEKEPNPQPAVVRLAAARALGMIGHERASDALATALEDEDYEVQTAAAIALRSLGWEPANDEQRARLAGVERQTQEGPPARTIAQSSPRTGSEKAEPAQATMNAQHTDPQVRADTARSLGKIGDEEAIASLASLLFDDADPRVMSAAAEALAEIADSLGDSRAFVLLGSAAHQERREDLRKAASTALGRLRPDQTFDLKAASEWFEKRVERDASPETKVEAGGAPGEFLTDLKTGKEPGKSAEQFGRGLPPIASKYLETTFVQVEASAGAGSSQFKQAIECWNRRDFDRAHALFEQALGLGLTPTYECFAYSQLGVIQLQRKNLALAIDHLLKCLEVHPKTATAAWEAAGRLCIIYDEAGATQEADSLRALAATANTRGLYLEATYENELRGLVRESLQTKTASSRGH